MSVYLIPDCMICSGALFWKTVVMRPRTYRVGSIGYGISSGTVLTHMWASSVGMSRFLLQILANRYLKILTSLFFWLVSILLVITTCVVGSLFERHYHTFVQTSDSCSVWIILDSRSQNSSLLNSFVFKTWIHTWTHPYVNYGCLMDVYIVWHAVQDNTLNSLCERLIRTHLSTTLYTINRSTVVEVLTDPCIFYGIMLIGDKFPTCSPARDLWVFKCADMDKKVSQN